ncbi:MAG TPA: hypothetical protein VI542_06025 [Candidatus Tectomicrobia bacterium]
MHPRLADDLIREVLACPCDCSDDARCCVRCACLVELACAIDVWLYEHLTGERWTDVVARRQEGERMARPPRISGLRGLGYTLLGWAVNVYAVLHAVDVFAVCAWKYWTGRIPPR